MAFGFGKDPFLWDFRCVNPADYELVINFEAKNKLLRDVFEKSRRKLARARHIKVGGSPDIVQKFDIEPRFLKLITTAISKQVRIVAQEVGSDGIIISNFDVVKAWFERQEEGDDWNIFVQLEGQYYRRR